ncbi:MAG: murein biosynthesis integral membrane protein MurJ [Spirochaetaceae bacterium]|nr:MAG: murein biosynthesis integral membrane protein MurJ [Spirochaetaceae bacterium]
MVEQAPTHEPHGGAQESMASSARSALLVMLTTFASRILGFVKMAVIGSIFGAGARADVLHLVFVIPNNLRKLLAEGALSSAFIPVVSERIVNDPEGGSARDLVRRLLTFQVLILVPVVGLSIVFAPQVIRVLLDFRDPEQQELAIELFRYIIPYLLFISIASVLVGTLNSHERFFVPAVAPLAFSISVITGIAVFAGRLDVFAMAAGVLVGGLVQLLLLVPQFRKLGYSFKLLSLGKDPYMRRILIQWLPVMATAGVYSVNQQIAMRFASGLDAGSGSAMQNALVFWQLPFGLFSASITTVLFPRMSRQIASDDREGVRKTLETGIRYLVGLLVPSAVFLGLFGSETIAAALQSGAFTRTNSLLAGDVLGAYSLGLFSVGAYTFIQRYFYARGDFRTPLVTSAIVLAIDVALSLWLKETWLRVRGLAVAHSVAFTVGLCVLLIRVRRSTGPLDMRAFFSTVLRTLLAALGLAVYLLVVKNLLPPVFIDGRSLASIAAVAFTAIGGAAITLTLMWLLNIEVVTVFLRNRIVRRL